MAIPIVIRHWLARKLLFHIRINYETLFFTGRYESMNREMRSKIISLLKTHNKLAYPKPTI